MQKFINNWSTTLTQSITASDTTIHIDTNAASQLAIGFQQGDYYLLTFDDGVNVEIVRVISINSNQLVAERGQEDTNSYGWSLGNIIAMRITVGTLLNLQLVIERILTANDKILVTSIGDILYL